MAKENRIISILEIEDIPMLDQDALDEHRVLIEEAVKADVGRGRVELLLPFIIDRNRQVAPLFIIMPHNTHGVFLTHVYSNSQVTVEELAQDPNSFTTLVIRGKLTDDSIVPAFPFYFREH